MVSTEVLSRRYNIVSYKVNKKVIELKEPIHEGINITIPNGDDYTLDTIAREMLEFTTKRIKELEAELPAAKEFYYDKLKYSYLGKRMFSCNSIK
jgi:c-di-GMP-binding flagellar brake protein YcgR